MKLIIGLADRIVFACGLLLALQIPQFLDHYTQRYAGYRDALADSMSEYQRNADTHYGGDLRRLINDLRVGNPGVREIGDKVERERLRLEDMNATLLILRDGSLWAKLRHLTLGADDADVALARGAMQDFKPGLPLTGEALICGAAGALLASGLFNALVWLFGFPFRKRYTTLKYN